VYAEAPLSRHRKNLGPGGGPSPCASPRVRALRTMRRSKAAPEKQGKYAGQRSVGELVFTRSFSFARGDYNRGPSAQWLLRVRTAAVPTAGSKLRSDRICARCRRCTSPYSASRFSIGGPRTSMTVWSTSAAAGGILFRATSSCANTQIPWRHLILLSMCLRSPAEFRVPLSIACRSAPHKSWRQNDRARRRIRPSRGPQCARCAPQSKPACPNSSIHLVVTRVSRRRLWIGVGGRGVACRWASRGSWCWKVLCRVPAFGSLRLFISFEPPSQGRSACSNPRHCPPQERSRVSSSRSRVLANNRAQCALVHPVRERPWRRARFLTPEISLAPAIKLRDPEKLMKSSDGLTVLTACSRT